MCAFLSPLRIGGLCYALAPFALHGARAAGTGFLIALVFLLVELSVRRASLSAIAGGACGALAGIFAALLFTMIVSRTSQAAPSKSFLELIALLGFTYLGMVLGFPVRRTVDPPPASRCPVRREQAGSK